MYLQEMISDVNIMIEIMGLIDAMKQSILVYVVYLCLNNLGIEMVFLPS